MGAGVGEGVGEGVGAGVGDGVGEGVGAGCTHNHQYEYHSIENNHTQQQSHYNNRNHNNTRLSYRGQRGGHGRRRVRRIAIVLQRSIAHLQLNHGATTAAHKRDKVKRLAARRRHVDATHGAGRTLYVVCAVDGVVFAADGSGEARVLHDVRLQHTINSANFPVFLTNKDK